MAKRGSRPSRKPRSSAPRPATPQPGPPAAAEQPFDLDRFEQLAFARHGDGIEEAFERLHSLLMAMERGRGDLPEGLLSSRVPGGEATPELERLNLVWTRIAHAVSALFLNPRFEALNWQGFEKLLLLQKQLATLFHASSQETSDAALLAFNISSEPGTLTVSKDDLYKVLILYSLESQYDFRLITNFEQADREAVTFTCIALCSTPFCGSERSYKRRNELLRWLCDQLREHALSEAALYLLTVTGYMTCSYADAPDKHAIKGLIHQQWRHLLAAQGIGDLCAAATAPDGAAATLSTTAPSEKPTILILHEWLRSGCAMHRCYANWIAALREQFHTVGMGLKEATAMDPEAIALFDHYVPLPEGVTCLAQVRAVHTWCRQHRPAIVYYPSIGMGAHTVAAASIRLAPLQVMTCGHPASSFSPVIDRIALTEPREASEKLLLSESVHEKIAWIPQSLSFAHVRIADIESIHERREAWHARQLHPNYEVQIAISSSPMKLTNEFLEFLVSIERSSERKAGLHFFLADSRGALHLEIRAAIRNRLRNANVYPHLDYQDYLRALRVADVFVTPFPFGNSNTHIDYYRSGILGTCMQGREICSLYDASLLTWLRHPKDLIAENKEAYKQIVLRLINDQQWRGDIYDQVYGDTYEDVDAMNGDASLFCEYGFCP
ncbi:hypothetical protein NZK33_01975 [Cyanobium sp. FGCU-6]|nr:hypothetical protein [Cyanobium sp. FGCU6]